MFVDGKLVKEEIVPVENFQFISIGSIHIVIWPANQSWSAISAAEAPQFGKGDIVHTICADATIINSMKGKPSWLERGITFIICGWAASLLFLISLF
jgi:hypothetical protein